MKLTTLFSTLLLSVGAITQIQSIALAQATSGLDREPPAPSKSHAEILLEHRECQRCELSGLKATNVNLRGAVMDHVDLRAVN